MMTPHEFALSHLTWYISLHWL